MSCCDYGCTGAHGCAAHTEPEAALTCARASGGATEVGNIQLPTLAPIESLTFWEMAAIAIVFGLTLGIAIGFYQTFFN